MKIFTNKKIVQKIIIAIVIILSFNFITPTYSQAGFGGVLMGPIIDLFAGIGDAFMSALQFFMYDGNISLEDSTSVSKTLTDPFNSFLLTVTDKRDELESTLQKYGMEPSMSPSEENTDITIDTEKFDKGWLGWLPGAIGEKAYGLPIIRYTPEAIFSNKVPALDVNFINPTDWTKETGITNGEAMNEKSVTIALHSTIANWYIALRNLAIVALLSVLLYVGIRMIISSTASDKAKYKQMLLDWLVALCIVFFLHYIMSFILTVTDMITEGISASQAIEVYMKDPSGDFSFKTDLTGLCRLQIQYSDLGARMIYLIFYIALVIYTVMFTWTYVKRAITMAFLTLMAPLVAITYPIDKISDGKAQAYGIWLKEFIFNALLQPFHLIVYTIFLGSSMEIAVENPIYAILFLAFIIPSEKLLRKMFGFDKSSTAGAMGAAASILGGAAVMKSASNFIGRVGKSKGGSGKAGVRTKNATITDPSAPTKLKDMAATLGTGNVKENQNLEVSQNVGEDSPSLLNNGVNNLAEDGYQQRQSGLWIRESTDSGTHEIESSQPQLSQQTQARNRSIRDNFALRKDDNGKFNDSRGVGEWIGDGISQTFRDGRSAVRQSFDQKFGNTKFVRNVGEKATKVKDLAKTVKAGYNSNNPFSNTLRGAVGTTSKAAIATAKFAGKAAIGGTLGLAAGIAGDDLEDVFKFGAAGAALGVAGLPAIGRGIASTASDMRTNYETEAFGAEQAAIRAQDREQMKNAEYRDSMDKLYEELYKAEPSKTQSRDFAKHGLDYYNAGLTDTKDIKKSLKFEKELRDKMIDDGFNETDAAERAKKQAMVISSLTKEVDKKDLISKSKRDGWRDQFYSQLKDTGMSKEEAKSGADYTIKLLMKRHGLTPD